MVALAPWKSIIVDEPSETTQRPDSVETEESRVPSGRIDTGDAPLSRRSWLRRLINRLEVDRAVFFVIALRLWQVLAGPLSMILIAQFFTLTSQGYYYTFANLMALQAFCELGLHSVIFNLSSHEWATLSLNADGCISGETSALARLAGLQRFVAKWYRGVSALFVLGVGAAGIVLFSRSDQGVNWLGPWVALVALSGIVLWTWAMTTLLEGCHQVVAVGRMRLIQGVMGSLCVWLSFVLGWELWSAVVAVGVRLVGDVWLLAATYRKFFVSLQTATGTSDISWREEILPLQWRMGLRGIFGYFAFGLFTPIMFEYHGPIEAGRMGMTWTALSALEQVAFAWIGTRAASFGSLVAKRDYRELDRVFFRVLGISFALLVVGGVILCGAIASLRWDGIPLGNKIADRLLNWDVTALFCVGVAGTHVLRSLGTYLLAHKKDPLLLVALVSCSLMGGIVWLVGRDGGAMHMALAFAAVLCGFNLPLSWWVWRRCRREWHATASVTDTQGRATDVASRLGE